MSKLSEIKEEIEKIKTCIEFGHDFKVIEYYPTNQVPNVYRIAWECRNCKFTRCSTATKDQLKTLDECRKMTPENYSRHS